MTDTTTPWIDVLIAKLTTLKNNPTALAIAGDVTNLIAYLTNNRDLLKDWAWSEVLAVAQTFQLQGEAVAEDLVLEQLDPEGRIVRMERNAERLRQLAVDGAARWAFIKGLPGKLPWGLILTALLAL
jgi:hypothetical protein